MNLTNNKQQTNTQYFGDKNPREQLTKLGSWESDPIDFNSCEYNDEKAMIEVKSWRHWLEA